MQWQFIEPKKGDIIRVKFSSFYHYGIYLDDDNIVQFGLSPVLTSIADQKNVKVCLSNMTNRRKNRECTTEGIKTGTK